MDKKHCRGCDQDRYNHKGVCERPGIDAPVTSESCWHIESAQRIRRVEIPVHQIPPYTQKSHWYPSCYSKPGYMYVDPRWLELIPTFSFSEDEIEPDGDISAIVNPAGLAYAGRKEYIPKALYTITT